MKAIEILNEVTPFIRKLNPRFWAAIKARAEAGEDLVPPAETRSVPEMIRELQEEYVDAVIYIYIIRCLLRRAGKDHQIRELPNSLWTVAQMYGEWADYLEGLNGR